MSGSQTERVAREAEIWDGQTLQRDGYEAALAHANGGPARERRNDFVRAVAASVTGLDALEIGSHSWEATLYRFGSRPNRLVCINISQTELDQGEELAKSFNYPIEFRLMDAHKLDFPDASFDFVFGVAILHHLDFRVAMGEIARVLKPGGRLLFVEPLILNPVARLVRFLTPKARTPDEKPLGREELAIMAEYFTAEHLYTELFHVPAAVISRFFFSDPENRLTFAADWLDMKLLQLFPGLGPYHRSITVYGHRK